MARPLRVEFAGAVYHVTARGNARQDIYGDDADRRRFLELLGREINQQGWRCHAYCLMSNHYHLLIETPEPNLAAGMRRLNGVYTQAFNRRHHRVGHVFQGRYKAIIVDRDSYLLELCRYIVLNPVRAKLVRRAAEWRWSSYRATAGLGRVPDWLETDWVLGQFGRQRNRAQAAYRRFVVEGVGAPSPWEALRGQIFLGREPFLRRMERLISKQPLDAIPAAQTRPTRPKAGEVIAQVAAVYHLKPKAVLTRSHQPAFQAAVYLLRRAANLSLKDVAARAAVSPSRVSHIQRKLESRAPNVHLQRLLRLCKVKH